jgi:hypothetical protein
VHREGKVVPDTRSGVYSHAESREACSETCGREDQLARIGTRRCAKVRLLPAVDLALIALLALLLAACASKPPPVDQYSVVVPDDVDDRRGRFRDIYCAVLEARRTMLPYYESCDDALSPVRLTPAAPGRPVDLGPSRRGLTAAFVPGIGYACFNKWLNPPQTVAAHLRQFGFNLTPITVDALSGTSTNARQIRDAVLSMPVNKPPSLVLVGYSKGIADIFEALVTYPEIRKRVAAVVSISGAVAGSRHADDARQWQADLLRYWPGSECDSGDGKAVESLRPDVRNAWLAENPLPADIRYYTVISLPEPGRVSRGVERDYRKLGKIDWRNDSQLIYADQFVPNSTLLAFINADHLAAGVPIGSAHPKIGGIVVDKNQYPREALLEAVLRFIEEDLESE